MADSDLVRSTGPVDGLGEARRDLRCSMLFRRVAFEKVLIPA